MKRIAAIVLMAMSVGWLVPAKAEGGSVPQGAQHSRKVDKQQEKRSKKAMKDQEKAIKKYEKQQRKAAKNAAKHPSTKYPSAKHSSPKPPKKTNHNGK
jgi:hypothetical protein